MIYPSVTALKPCMATKEAFVTIKDHKDNFEVNPTYHLINPAKSDSERLVKPFLMTLTHKLETTLARSNGKTPYQLLIGLRTLKTNIGTRLFPLT